MRREVLLDIDPTGLEHVVGPAAFERGAQYARGHAVVQALWDPDACALYGTVHGRLGDFYRTTAYMSPEGGGRHRFETGECTCPVGLDCKHAVALVLTAAGGASPERTPAAPRRPERWEQSLAALLDSGRARSDATATPLAVELSIPAPRQATAGSALRLVARLVRPAKTGGWANGGLSWSGLGTVSYHGEYDAAQVQVLKELYAVYNSGTVRSSYGYNSYAYRDEKSIELSACESQRLWSLLDEAEALGVRLVHARKALGEIHRSSPAELCIDVAAGDQPESLSIRPLIVVDDAPVDAAPVVFVGSEGHGVVYVGRAELDRDPAEWPLRLARLTRPVPKRLQALALGEQRLEIPAADRDRFAGEFYPRLRNLATVRSSDESFTPPAISAPTLVLRATFGAGHELGLRWDWAYDVDVSRLRVPLYPESADAGFRDLDAERRLLTGLDVGLETFGIWAPGTRQPLAPEARLSGIDTMRFSTEVLPLLDGLPGVVVEISGEPADYREAGDSLRIGVSADPGADPDQTDWFDLGVTIAVEGQEVPFAVVFTALARGETHLLLDNGAYFSLEKPELVALRRLIDEARALQDKPDGPLRISRFQAGLWSELAELGVVDRQARAWQRQVEGLLAPGTVHARPEPSGLAARFRPYQAEGFGWLAFLWEHRLGGILADDMGLGKTLQALALIRHARQDEPVLAPFLIVAPTSVVANWAAEAGRFAPDLTVAAVTDTLRKRGQSLAELTAGADVVVTSYTLFRLDFDAYSGHDWAGLVLDEAQFVKNHQSKAYQCARKLAAPFKLAITGTPMENNLMELWSLLSITAPGLFPSPVRFRDYYARPIERGDTDLLAQLRRRIKPLVKRRTKEQVAADLPAKQEQVLDVELHPRHRTIYQRQLQRVRQQVLGLIDDLDRNRFAILRSLTLLRQLSLHAGLVDDAHRELPSSKVDVLVEQLADVTGGGHRALVFSQFTGFLDVVRRRLDADGVEYCYLDGKTRRRADVVRRFKDGSAPVFLISLKAGGFGLNLTEADYCFLLDPWWNPATEAQAVDRTHRIGQTRNVMVYRLIARDTIEEKVMALKERKAELFASVMDDGNAFGSTLDADDIRELFS
jgi:superfamily II DNA or RNA helicase